MGKLTGITTEKFSSLFLLVLVIIFALAGFLYSLSFHAPWFYDDIRNLNGLSGIHDLDSAMAFIMNGVAGEGRPLANLAFLLNLADWPGNPSGFRSVNMILHILNGVLLAILSWMIACLFLSHHRHVFLFVIFVTGLWLFQPLAFSATLMPVQRMTILAASFVLLGLIFYIVGRERMAGMRWRSGLLISSAGLIVCSLLGVMAKENAALLVFFAAVLELTLLRNLTLATPRTVWFAWRVVFFMFPAILLLGLVVLRWDSMQSVYAIRDFTFAQRLATQSVLGWEYVRQMFVPDVRGFGPFHDDVVVRDFADPLVWLALAGWMLVWGVAVTVRKRTVLPLFALVWFWVGHLLESTVFPLELYFEHRNYIPAVGPLAALVMFVLPYRWAGYALSVLMLVMAVCLWQVSSLWSDSLKAGHAMVEYHPLSPRAVQYLAIEYYRRGDAKAVYKVYGDAAGRMSEQSGIQMVHLRLACLHEPPEKIRQYQNTLVQSAASMQMTIAAVDEVERLLKLIQSGRCQGMNIEALLEVARTLAVNPDAIPDQAIMHHLYRLIAEMLDQLGSREEALHHMEKAYQSGRNPETAIRIAELKWQLNDVEGAVQFLDSALTQMPAGVLKRRDDWRLNIQNTRNKICETDRRVCE